MKCNLCDFSTHSYQGLAKHVKAKHDMEPKSYYDEYMKKDNEGICTCGKITPFLNMQKGYQKHCCYKCAQNDPNVHNNFKVSNPQQNNESKNKSTKTCIERYGGKGYGSSYIQTKAKITRFNNRHKGGMINMSTVKQVDFTIKKLDKVDQYFGFSLEEDPMYLMPDGTIFHNSGKSRL